MSTTIQQIRSLIQDVPLYQVDSVTADGTDKVVQVTYFPVIGTTVTVTPTPGLPTFVVDEQNGVVTFASAPTAGVYTFTYSHVLLLDQTIQDFLDIQGDSNDQVRLGAADALDAIASSQALIQKKIKLLDLDTDGPALAKTLRDHADMLRQLVYNTEYNESTFDVVEQINDLPGWREKVIKDWMRQQ